jgi:hypothetical protein
VVVVDKQGATKVRDARGGCELVKEVSKTTKALLRVDTVDGDRLVLSGGGGGVWELGRLPNMRVVWHGCGKALVMEGKRALFVVSLEA